MFYDAGRLLEPTRQHQPQSDLPRRERRVPVMIRQLRLFDRDYGRLAALMPAAARNRMSPTAPAMM